MRATNPGTCEIKRRKNPRSTHFQFKRKRFKNMLADVRDRIDENNKAMVPDEIPFEAEDGALVTAAKSGSIGAFGCLVKLNMGRIVNDARRVRASREDAELQVQQS